MVRIAPNCDIPNLSKIVDDTLNSNFMEGFDSDEFDCEVFDSDDLSEEIGD